MSEMSDSRRGEVEALAAKNPLLAGVIGLFLGPLGYVYVGSWRWAVINFFTFNYLLLGIALVPLHTVAMILGARWKLRDSGETEGDGSLWNRLGQWYGQRRL